MRSAAVSHTAMGISLARTVGSFTGTGWAELSAFAVGGQTTAEPASTGPGEHTLIGLAQFASKVGQAVPGVAQEPSGGVFTNLVDHGRECRVTVGGDVSAASTWPRQEIAQDSTAREAQEDGQ